MAQRQLLSKPGYTTGRGWCCSGVLHQIRGRLSTKALTVRHREFTCLGARVDVSTETDIEYQYWPFMVAHPAHALLPPGSVSEAIDILTWSYTGGSLPLLIFCCQLFTSL